MIRFDLISKWFLGGVALRTQVIAVIGALLLMWVVIYLIRGGKLKPGYSIGWFFVGFTMVVFALFSPILNMFARLMDISYAPAAFLLILVGGLFLLALHFSVLTTRYDRQIRELVQEYALLCAKLRKDDK